MDFRNIGSSAEELRAALQQLAEDFDAHNHDGFNSKGFETIKVQTVSGEVVSIRKTSFGDTRNGIWMGIVNNVVKFILGNSTNFVSWDGTTLTITGTIVGSSIYIPNAVSPQFSVDTSGNVMVNSLQRNDFHWFTLFESLDGYSKTFTGAGTTVLGYQYWIATTGASNGDNCRIVKSLPDPYGSFSWAKNRKFKLAFFASGDGGLTAEIVTGDTGGRRIGFYLSGINGSTFSLNARINDGTTTTTSTLGTYSYGAFLQVEARCFVTRVEFYVNGVLILTISANLPSGTTSAAGLLDVLLSTTGGAQALSLSFVDFWQSN